MRSAKHIFSAPILLRPFSEPSFLKKECDHILGVFLVTKLAATIIGMALLATFEMFELYNSSSWNSWVFKNRVVWTCEMFLLVQKLKHWIFEMQFEKKRWFWVVDLLGLIQCLKNWNIWITCNNHDLMRLFEMYFEFAVVEYLK